jgi:hypothetical protein
LTFAFKTQPFKHQLAEFELSRRLPARALLWEQGCGKTKPIIDTSAYLWDAGEITGHLVLAPNGVHSNWVHDELPAHLSCEAKVLWWRSSKAETKWFREEVEVFLKYPGLKVLCMSYDAIMTDYGAKIARRFLTSNRCLFTCDESHRIKKPGAKRTMRVRAAGKYAPYRRIATGTIVDDTPFDVYSQLDFVHPGIWQQLGIQDAATFRSYFGVFRAGFNYSTGQHFEQVIGFRNLSEMKQVLDSVGSRLMKKDVLDLPPKLYSKFYFELSPAQARLYKQLAEDMRATLPDGANVTADLAITQLLRFQQCVSGYLPADREEDLRPIEANNPRIRALREVVEDVTGKFIVVGKYDIDIDTIAATLREDGIETVVVDGRTDDDDREAAKKAFQKGSARAFVMKPMEGLTLTAGSTMIFYDNGFHLRPRLQAEDRAHRIGTLDPVKYIDIVAQGTVDERIIERLRQKQEMAGVVQGDEVKAWI